MRKDARAMPKGMKVTQEMFDAIKAMSKGGASNNDIARFAGVSTATVSRVKAANSFDEYEPTQKPKKEEPQESKQTVIFQASWQMTQEQRQTNEQLKQISQKLAFIVDELCGVKSDAEQDS